MLHVHRCMCMYVHFAIVFLSQSCASAAARGICIHIRWGGRAYTYGGTRTEFETTVHTCIYARDMRIGGRSRCTWMSRTRGSISDPRGLLELERSCSGSRTGNSWMYTYQRRVRVAVSFLDGSDRHSFGNCGGPICWCDFLFWHGHGHNMIKSCASCNLRSTAGTS